MDHFNCLSVKKVFHCVHNCLYNNIVLVFIRGIWNFFIDQEVICTKYVELNFELLKLTISQTVRSPNENTI